MKASDRPKVSTSKDSYNVLFGIWNKDTLEYQESAYLLLLNKACSVLGFKLLSIGGSSGTVVDVKMVFGIALKANASAIILGHNHPSGNLKPSDAHLDLTRKLKEAGKLLDLALLDHLILTPDGDYYSFADEGLI